MSQPATILGPLIPVNGAAILWVPMSHLYLIPSCTALLVILATLYRYQA